jgi:hypothetical protein
MRKEVRCRVLITFSWVLALTIPALAQTKTISGIISDQNGVPLLKAETVLVTLNVTESKLNEVVVVGYGTRSEAMFLGRPWQDELFYFDDILLVK